MRPKVQSLEQTMDALSASETLQEGFQLEDLIEDGEDDIDKIKEYNNRAASILRELDLIQNEIQNFYADMRSSNLPFFGFNELHEYSKKLDNTLHRAVDLVKKTKSALTKHVQ